MVYRLYDAGMSARLLLNDKIIHPNGLIVERRIWLVPVPVYPCTHRYRYSLFAGFLNSRLIGYDNERGKGDHVHRHGIETEYFFQTPRKLVADFDADVTDLLQRNP